MIHYLAQEKFEDEDEDELEPEESPLLPPLIVPQPWPLVAEGDEC